MKSFAVLASFVALAGFSGAQFGDGLPKCAQDCAGQYFSGSSIAGCQLGDYKCVCNNKGFIDGIACCLAKPGGCNSADQSSAVSFASTVCAGFGANLPTAVACSSTTSGGASPTSTTTSGSGAAATPNSSGGVPSSSTRSGFVPKQTGMGNAAGLVGIVAAGVALL